jgi:hypothetical protein
VLVDDADQQDPTRVDVTPTTVDGFDLPTVNEVQVVTVRASGGTFRLSRDGATWTGALAYDASAATVQAALEALYGAGNVAVEKMGVPGSSVGSTYVLRFRGGLSAADVAQVLVEDLTLVPAILGTGGVVDPLDSGATRAWVSTRVHGRATVTGVDEVQVIELQGSTGTFTLQLALGAGTTQVTAVLAASSTLDDVLAALRALPGVAATDVEGGVVDAANRIWWIRFVGQFAGKDVAQLAVGGDARVLTWTLRDGTGSAVVDQVQVVRTTGTTGSFRLRLSGWGVQTADISAGATALDVENALQLALLGSRFALDLSVERFAAPAGEGGLGVRRALLSGCCGSPPGSGSTS